MSIEATKTRRFPHVLVLMTGMILFCSILTYVIPSGTYQRERVEIGDLTRPVVIPGSYEQLEKQISLKGMLIGDEREGKASPVSLLGFLTAIPRGMEKAADIIFLVIIIGGVYGILQRTGTITALLYALLTLFAGRKKLLTIVIMTAIAIGGSTLGMGEEFIPLVPLFLAISSRMGYDRIYGLALVILARQVGFAAGTTNPFNVQIAQGIAEVPLCSGLLFRVIFAVCCMALTLRYVIRYGRKIERNPANSVLAGCENSVQTEVIEPQALRPSHIWILISTIAIFALTLYGIQTMGWWMNELSGGFVLIGCVAVFVSRLSASEATKAFIEGMREILIAAMVVGFARGIQVVMEDGQIMDSIVYYVAGVLQNVSETGAAEGMLIFQSILNFLIPSGTGQAVVTMPLMAPLSDVVGLTRQTAVFAFTCGDGFSNSIIPTSGLLMAMLTLAEIPYEKWLRFVLPLFCVLSVRLHEIVRVGRYVPLRPGCLA